MRKHYTVGSMDHLQLSTVERAGQVVQARRVIMGLAKAGSLAPGDAEALHYIVDTVQDRLISDMRTNNG